MPYELTQYDREAIARATLAGVPKRYLVGYSVLCGCLAGMVGLGGGLLVMGWLWIVQ
jgi:hypothetical protein